MSTRGPLLTLGSVVVVAGVLLGVNALVGPSTAPTSSSGYSAPTATGPPPSSPAPSSTALQAVYAGETGGSEATVAVAVNGNQAAAYLCDGASVETWLQGSVTGDQISLTGRNTAALTGTISGAAMSGTVTTSTGQAWPFTADQAQPPAGIYEARTTIGGLATRIGWVVLPDGTQVGITNTDGNRSPAPRLDLADKSFTLDGAGYQATPIDGGATVVGQ